MSKYELLPCPFCGAMPTFDTNGIRTWVFCFHCGARGKGFYNGRSAQKQAADAWNTRVNKK